MEKEMTYDEKIISKVWWVVNGIILNNIEHNKRYVNEYDILRVISILGHKDLNPCEIRTILDIASRHCCSVLGYESINDHTIGFKLIK